MQTQVPMANSALRVVSELLRILALIVLILYGWHFGNDMVRHFGTYVQAEKRAISASTAGTPRSAVPTGPTGGGTPGPTGGGTPGTTAPGGGSIFEAPASQEALSWIFVCILAILYFLLVFGMWFARIVTLFARVRACTGFFGCLLAWILFIIEFIAFILVTFVSLVFVFVNLVALT